MPLLHRLEIGPRLLVFYYVSAIHVELKQAGEKKLTRVYRRTVLQALGIGEDDPPPWLINMQRYGPPVSYPHLRIPGLNAPIPNGARYGFGPSEWGKPPVDSTGQPLYGGEMSLSSLFVGTTHGVVS